MDEPSHVDHDDDDQARVARAADELGLDVPRRFKYLGLGPDGKSHAICEGNAADLRATVAILRRLEGKPVEECLTEPTDAAGPPVEWEPPADFHDAEAWLAYVEERRRHPEWPRVYNGAGDWAIGLISALLGTGGLTGVAWAAVSAYNVNQRRRIAEYAIDAAERQGARVNPEAVIRAFVEGPRAVNQLEGDDCSDNREETPHAESE
ncbi:hypothetical protein BJY16_001982 [Actinoplanes octamycinicus]|uniref:Uncharacterized protein n=1 Tax=Actinoplanes octamycinicus TaxID=135948 RepID=A0A7W7GUG1_9ACTN|nr:hypothetical protein [Actinoplanes octamycinicus]MBB4738523.1 hypothetical protein [Actinoplanes octamycinicus]